MTLHPEDLRYWIGWLIFWALIFAVARLWLVQPLLHRLDVLIDCLRK